MALKTENVGEVVEMIALIPGLPGEVIKNKKSVSVRISDLPKFVISDGIAAIDDNVMPAYDAAYVLMEFWKKNEKQLRTVLGP